MLLLDTHVLVWLDEGSYYDVKIKDLTPQTASAAAGYCRILLILSLVSGWLDK